MDVRFLASLAYTPYAIGAYLSSDEIRFTNDALRVSVRDDLP